MTIIKNFHQLFDAELGQNPVTSGRTRHAAILCLDATSMANVLLASLSLATLRLLKVRCGGEMMQPSKNRPSLHGSPG